MRLFGVLWCLAALAACGGPIDPDRPPLPPDYEPPPVHSDQIMRTPGRI